MRETAGEIGISHATLSRVERGYVPDLETFRKICTWLEVDPAEVLGMKTTSSSSMPVASVHFRKDQAIKPTTATALGDLIVTAQRALMAMENSGT